MARRRRRAIAAVARWERITGRPAPSPALLNGTGPRPASQFVQWRMGLEPGWVADPIHGMTPSQQITA